MRDNQFQNKKNGVSPVIEFKERVFQSAGTPHKKEPKGILDKSQSRISSFFGLGGSGKTK